MFLKDVLNVVIQVRLRRIHPQQQALVKWWCLKVSKVCIFYSMSRVDDSYMFMSWYEIHELGLCIYVFNVAIQVWLRRIHPLQQMLHRWSCLKISKVCIFYSMSRDDDLYMFLTIRLGYMSWACVKTHRMLFLDSSAPTGFVQPAAASLGQVVVSESQLGLF